MMDPSDLRCLKKLEATLQDKINYLVKHTDDVNAKKLPGLIEALKDLYEIKKGTLKESER